MQETERLVREWNEWTRLAGMTGTSVEEGDDAVGVQFRSSDGDFRLRKEGGWWVIDESDDRGKTCPATATFSSRELAEKYLVWTWGSTARTTVGAEQLGRVLRQRGFNPDVPHAPALRDNFVELATPDGLAIVPNSKSVILNHVLTLTPDQLDEMLRQGL